MTPTANVLGSAAKILGSVCENTAHLVGELRSPGTEGSLDIDPDTSMTNCRMATPPPVGVESHFLHPADVRSLAWLAVIPKRPLGVSCAAGKPLPLAPPLTLYTGGPFPVCSSPLLDEQLIGNATTPTTTRLRNLFIESIGIPFLPYVS